MPSPLSQQECLALRLILALDCDGHVEVSRLWWDLKLAWDSFECCLKWIDYQSLLVKEADSPADMKANSGRFCGSF